MRRKKSYWEERNDAVLIAVAVIFALLGLSVLWDHFSGGVSVVDYFGW